MKAECRLLLLTLLSTALASSCRGIRDLNEEGGKLADVNIAEIEGRDYTSYQFALEQQDGGFRVPRATFNRGNQKISAKVPAGTYKIILDYFKDKSLVLSTTFCSDEKRNDIQKFKPGLNEIAINVCDLKGDADVVITPKPKEPGKPSTPVAGDGFSIQNGELIDPSGKPFVIRGINMPFAYYFDQSFNAIENAKSSGFNSVRMVWCANNFKDSGGRCQDKDFRTAADLDRVITKITDMRMVTVFNLQNATGQDTLDPLNKMADYLLSPEIKAVLMKHKKNVIVNIANEWMGKWDKNRDWVDGYKTVIQKLRDGGLPHVLVVDARGWGQDFSSIPEHYEELMQLDKNLLFSAHMYAVFNTDQKVQDALTFVRSKKLPFMIGEFGCSHYSDQDKQNHPVACDAILRETASSSYPIGTMAWSYAGNRSEESELDVFNASDWKTLSSFGEKVVTGPYGVKTTAKQACYFDMAQCR
jgi:mannan endo-1,4-beta-mannosidase